MTDALAQLYASGAAVDLVILLLGIEAAWLLASRRMAPVEIVTALGPGLLILLALRAAVTGAAWPWIALPLAASFPLHLADLARRGAFRSRRRASRAIADQEAG